MNMEGQVIQVNLDDIIPNRFQPRIAFDEKALTELAASIKEHGIIQPLVLRKLGKKYEIIAGERRYKAATMAGLSTVPAVISNVDDNKSAEVALVENIQRKDLTPIEEARSYKNLLDKGYLTQEQLAKKMGLSQSAVSNKLRLLNLDVKVQQALLDNKISERHARALLKITNMEEQRKWLDRIIKERITVKKLDELLKNVGSDDNQDGGDVPLVDTPNIEQIKEQATDINDNKPKNIANMLVSEDTMTEYSGNLPDQNLNNGQSNVVNNEMPNTPMTNMMEQNPAPVVNNLNNIPNNQEVLNDVPPTSNKFFNPLEDTPATMDNLNPFAVDANFTVDQAPKADGDVEIFDMPNNSNVNNMTVNVEQNNINNNPQPMTMDSMNQNLSTLSNENSTPNMDMNVNSMSQGSMPSAMDELNPNNKFFQPIQDQSISSPMMDTPINPTPVNPMDNVNNLINENNKEAIMAEQNEMSMGSAINDIREKVNELNNKGLIVTIDEADLDTAYQMNISILK